MRSKSHLPGHLSLLAIGVLAVVASASISKVGALRYQQLAASATPSAADQIWEIGNQPVGYLQTMPTPQLSEGQINMQNVWGQTPAFDNIQVQPPSISDYTGSYRQFSGATQSDIWTQLDSQVQSSQAQVANDPIQQTTFTSGPPDISTMQASFQTNNPDLNLNLDAPINESSDSSWFSSVGGTIGGWANDTYDYFFGAPAQDMNGCPDGTCATIGIRG